ncbi:GH16492 [Drosophila grimshawi]|uniref:GH16492 n=1 Tax=Drosophila grimshawi TaxID=7222 RepID=B4J0K1_DROGR|nr:GH16492 [Drosophila grimshawi]
MLPIITIKPKQLRISNCVFKFITDQGTQTDCLLITEDEEEPKQLNGNKTPLRKSASFSSSTTAQSQSPGSSSLGSATSTMSLRSSTPQRAANNQNQSGSSRTLRSDTINTFQKWETTVESISYVSTKTVSISDLSQEPQLQAQAGKRIQSTN